MYEIVSFKSDTGVDVQITPQDVKNILCPGATDKEVAMFLGLCQAQRLNPFIKDVYLLKYGNAPATIITGKETFTKRAQANPDYEGFEAGVSFIDRDGNVNRREGSAVYKTAGETLVGGWCRVFVKGRQPFFDEVTLEEYSTGKSGWAKMPATMIRKVALVHALREAFPDSFQGLYAAEEMGKQGETVVEMESAKQMPVGGVEKPQEAEFVEMATDEQHDRIARLAVDLSGLRDVPVDGVRHALFNTSAMQQVGAKDGDEMTREQADIALAVLDKWWQQAHREFKEEELRSEMRAEIEAEKPSGEIYDEDVLF